ncbi:sensor histidine kinase [Amycolatopsis jiangsuensis]|uniref:histidine kinase n=1 Tax=Amycolatopsis jiangsuensis TaxID=1181879 RepID=A0A840IU37_9PSEU|nr:histidine kinase [Amycolatopsis jiangsuensis]MBB4684965.1 signal transduction histidine kinase [Amycolatopsis jiangsuensis]
MNALRRLEGVDWVRWGVLTLPSLFAIPSAPAWTWPLIALVAACSVPVLLLRTVRPPWLLPTVLVLVIAVTGALWVLRPGGFTSVSMFGATFFTLRSFGRLASAFAVAAATGTIVAWSITQHLGWLNALAILCVLIVMVLLAANRRSRVERLEQTELALARAQTAAEEHGRAAALAERARIARELHDVLAHSLAGLALNLQGARLMLVRDGASDDALAQVERAQKLASEGLSEARNAVAALREDVVPVERTVSDLLTAYRLDSGARADLVVEGEQRELDASVGATLVRAVQEALVNTRKHAAGAEVDVRLVFGADEVALTIADRQGRRPPDAPAPGYGLRGMSERVALLDGALESGPGEDGWRIQLTVPV